VPDVEAQREAFRVPVDDRHIRYVEYPDDRFSLRDPSRVGRLVEITICPGRSPEAMRTLFGSIARSVRHARHLGPTS
jgi:hypothetical protein